MSAASLPRPELRRLLALMTDGLISDSDFAVLNNMLRDDADARRAYFNWVELEAVLNWEHDEHEGAQAPAIMVERAPSSTSPVTLEPVVSSDRRFAFGLIGLAAAVVLAGVVMAVVVTSSNQKPAVDVPTPGHRAAPVATLIDSTATVIANNDIANPGDDYAAGNYSIESGEAEFMLTNAVNVRLRGHTRIALHNDMHASLSQGEATFVCPPAVTGYTVYLPGDVRVVDLGTSFTVTVDDDGAVAVDVIEGLVRVIAGGETIELPEGKVARLADGAIVSTERRPTLVTGQMRLLARAPRNLQTNAFEDSKHLVVIPERMEIAPSRGIVVDVNEPGIWSPGGQDMPKHTIDPGTVMDVYIVRLDPVGFSRGKAITREGEVMFNRPVLGVITQGQRNIAYDNRFASKKARRDSNAPYRGLNGNDSIEISEDRRTVRVKMTTFASNEIRIIVQADGGNEEPVTQETPR